MSRFNCSDRVLDHPPLGGGDDIEQEPRRAITASAQESLS
jgi:hypothetical protein